MKFYATTYNYHGLKRSDVRRVWEEVFTHYGDIRSSHVFTELKLVQAGGVRKAYATCIGEGSMGQRNWQESPSPLIVGCTRYTTSSKRKGPGDSLAMQEGHPRRLHQQALLIILSSNNLIAHVSLDCCSSVSALGVCGKTIVAR